MTGGEEPCQDKLISFMATTAPKRSLYRQRRIDAMLQEGTTTSSPPLKDSSSAQQTPPGPQSPGRKQALPLRSSRLPFLYIVIAAVLLGTLTVFLLLFRRDGPPASKAQIPIGPVASPAPAQASAPSVPAPVASPSVEAPKQPEPAPEPVQFKIKRSKSFEKIGPIRLRLIRTFPKRNVCELYVASGGPSYQKQVHLDKPVQIDLLNGAKSAELVVTSIKADQISGSVQ